MLIVEVKEMDANRFGSFVAERRKKLNMTQADLATKIHVTDKAVSRWERGLGFPDIKTIEPLADALEVSIVEIMKSEEIVNQEVSVTEASNVLTDSLNMAAVQQQQERKSIWLIISIGAVISSMIHFFEQMDWSKSDLMLQFTIPWEMVSVFIVLLIGGVIRKIQGKPCGQMIAVAFIVLLIPLLLSEIVFLVMALFT